MGAAYTPGDETTPGPKKKPLVRRAGKDRSQMIRHWVQGVFLLLNVWIGIEFVIWARFFETRGASAYIQRPAGVDGWLPIAGLMNLKYFLLAHRMPSIHPAAMVLAAVFLLSSALVKKSFCSWLCPVGTASEALWKLGRKIFRRNFRLPHWLDLSLRTLKYILLALFMSIIVIMSAESLNGFMEAPFGIIADVKMLNFFREIGVVGVSVLVAFTVASVFVQNFWCRYLCPYGALMGIASLLSPVKIRRDADACIDCAKCAKACPSALAVDKLVQIRSVECTGCMECVAACPAENALQFALPPRQMEGVTHWRARTIEPWKVAAILAVIFFGLIGTARRTGHWQTYVSRDVYMQLVPHADEFSH